MIMPLNIEHQIRRTGIDVSYPSEDSMKLSLVSPLGYGYSVQIDFEDGEMKSQREDGSLNRYSVLPRIDEVTHLHMGEIDRMAKERILAGEPNSVSAILKDCEQIQNKLLNMNDLLQTADKFEKLKEEAKQSDKIVLYSDNRKSFQYAQAARNAEESAWYNCYDKAGNPDMGHYEFVVSSALFDERDIVFNALDKPKDKADVVIFKCGVQTDNSVSYDIIPGYFMSGCMNYLAERGNQIDFNIDKNTGELEGITTWPAKRTYEHDEVTHYRFRMLNPKLSVSKRNAVMCHTYVGTPDDILRETTLPLGGRVADLLGIRKTWDLDTEKETEERPNLHKKVADMADRMQSTGKPDRSEPVRSAENNDISH